MRVCEVFELDRESVSHDVTLSLVCFLKKEHGNVCGVLLRHEKSLSYTRREVRINKKAHYNSSVLHFPLCCYTLHFLTEMTHSLKLLGFP